MEGLNKQANKPALCRRFVLFMFAPVDPANESFYGGPQTLFTKGKNARSWPKNASPTVFCGCCGALKDVRLADWVPAVNDQHMWSFSVYIFLLHRNPSWCDTDYPPSAKAALYYLPSIWISRDQNHVTEKQAHVSFNRLHPPLPKALYMKGI